MKFSRCAVAGLLLIPLLLWSADTWQIGRIVSVKKNINTKTLYWVVNTPVTQDETTYTITVHWKQKIYLGVYAPGKNDPPPPEDWTPDRPVHLLVDADALMLQTAAGTELRVKIAKTKAAPEMKPVTSGELASLDAPKAPPAEAPQPSLIGLDKPAPKAAPPPPAPAAASPPPPAQAMGSVSVRTSPYLADVYVDNQNMGYTPAKVNLPAGKHTIRFEKTGFQTWSKEITVTEGSELLVDATLQRK